MCIYPQLFFFPCLPSDLTPSSLSSQTQTTMGSAPYTSTMVSPRPALTPSSSRSQTPTRCPSAETSSYCRLYSRPNLKGLSQSSVDSSGYSSSEGTQRGPSASTTSTSSTSRIHSTSGAPSAGYRSRISSAFINLMGEYLSAYHCVCMSPHLHVISMCFLCFVQTHSG